MKLVINVQDRLSKYEDIMLALMGLDYEVFGNTYNLIELGWTFEYSQKEDANGTCRIAKNILGDFLVKKLMLSEWLIPRIIRSDEGWIDIMLHEIAHALDIEYRGTSAHDNTWLIIAQSIGCSGEITNKNEYIDGLNEKYLIYCPICNEMSQHSFVDEDIMMGNISCGECSPYNFNDNCVLQWKVNPNYEEICFIEEPTKNIYGETLL